MLHESASPLATICAELQCLQRQQVVVMKSRIMQSNRLQAVVAGTMGYHSGLADKDRKDVFAKATELIKAVETGKADSALKPVILTTLVGINAFDEMQGQIKKTMEKFAAQLPAAAWASHPNQRGFGLGRLAVVVGESGDLNNYSNPAKLWKRMGCAPYTFGDKTQMGSTWRSGKGGKLPRKNGRSSATRRAVAASPSSSENC